ncbi:MAG: rane protein [Panacagrimonas sp.]|jgi:uncharacterized membrane protein|nr:DUF2269 domain-containing protein [Panacagrimonas sp.]MCC2657524.1 rane protein [Panacagrimonas sp.]
MSAYVAWKLLHVLSATILFGTGLGIAFFAWFGYRRAMAIGQIDGLRTVLRLTVIADTCFTAPAVVIQFVSGVALMKLAQWPLLGSWGATSLGLFVLVGLLWLPVVVIQIQMSREAARVESVAALSAGFHRRFAYWFVLGVPAFLIVVGIVYLMVVKPLPFS